jgi:hypothetical protein
MSRGRRKRLNRRQVLAAVAFAAAAGRGEAQTKASQADAEYRAEPKNGLSCEVCTQFRPPHDCQIVLGEISPKGWCKFFDLPD